MATNLNDLLNQFQTDVGLVNEFVKGDATLMVVGTVGTYPSLAKIAADSGIAFSNISTSINAAQLELATVITNGQSSITSVITNGQSGINSLLVTGNVEISNLITASQSTIGSLVTDSQNAICTAETTMQAALASTLNNSQISLNNFLTTSNVEINNVVNAGQASLTALETTWQNNLATLVYNIQQSIAVDQAALLASQEALSSVINATHTSNNRVYTFGPSLSWDVLHDMKTTLFSLTIKNVSGDTVYEESNTIIDTNEFIINFTEPEEGSVYVVFYYN